jgi:hypothetical protein
MNKRLIQQFQAQLAKIQEELSSAMVEASSGGGVVTVRINGQQQVCSVKISPEVLDPEDVGLLEDMVLAAFNEAIGKSKELAASKLSALTGGLKIPGLL